MRSEQVQILESPWAPAAGGDYLWELLLTGRAC